MPAPRPRALAPLLAFFVLLGLVASTPASAEVDPGPRTWWGVDGMATGTTTDRILSEVWAIERTAYIAALKESQRPAIGGGVVDASAFVSFAVSSSTLGARLASERLSAIERVWNAPWGSFSELARSIEIAVEDRHVCAHTHGHLGGVRAEVSPDEAVTAPTTAADVLDHARAKVGRIRLGIRGL